MEYYKINCQANGEWSTTLVSGVDTIGKKLLILCPVGIRNIERKSATDTYFPLDNILKSMGKNYHKYQYTLYTTGGILELNTIDALLHKIPIVNHSWEIGEHSFPMGGSTIIATRIKDIVTMRLDHLDLEVQKSGTSPQRSARRIVMNKKGELSLRKEKSKDIKFNMKTYIFT